MKIPSPLLTTCVVLACFALSSEARAQTTYAWQLTNGASWAEPANWSPAGPPDAADATALFAQDFFGPTNNVALTVGLGGSFTINALSHTDTGTVADSTLTVNFGTNALSQLTFAGTAPAIYVTNVVSFSVPVVATNGLTISGAAGAVFSGTNTFAGTMSLIGPAEFRIPAAMPTNADVVVSSGSRIEVAGNSGSWPVTSTNVFQSLTLSGVGDGSSRGAVRLYKDNGVFHNFGPVALAADARYNVFAGGLVTVHLNHAFSPSGAAPATNRTLNLTDNSPAPNRGLYRLVPGTFSITNLNLKLGSTEPGRLVLLCATNFQFGPTTDLIIESPSGANAWSNRVDLAGTTQLIRGLSATEGRSRVMNSGTNTATLIIEPSVSFTQTFAGVIGDGAVSNAIDIVKTGAGRQILSGSNSFTGTVDIRTGTLEIGNTNALISAASVTVSNGAMLEVRHSGGGTFAYQPVASSISGVGATSFAGGLYFNTAGNLVLRWNGAINLLASSTISQFGSTVESTLAAPIAGTGPLTFGGRGGSDVTGLSSITLLATNSWTGGTVIANRDGLTNFSVRLGIDHALPTNTVVTFVKEGGSVVDSNTTSSLDLNGFNQQIGGLATSGEGNIKQVINTSVTPATLTLFATNSTTFSGRLGGYIPGQGNFGVVKTGPSFVVLTGINPYTGPTTISQGIFRVSGSLTGTGLVTVGGAAGANATLAGTGFVQGATVVVSSLNPGGGVGTLTFGDNLRFATNSALNWEYTNVQDLVVAATATFDGPWLVSVQDLLPMTNGTYTLLTTTGGITGFVAHTVSGITNATAVVSQSGNDIVLTLSPLSGLTPFETWQTNYFGTTTNENAAYDQDPDGDGVNNLLEYAFATSPVNGASVALPQTGTSGDFLTITVPRNSNATDISYVVQGSSNLLDWATNVVLTATNPAPAGSTVTYTNGTANSVQPQQFLRVKVTQP